MTYTYLAYIDESGDEGFGKLRQPNIGGQSRWLGLGAVIVSKDADRFMTSWRDEIMNLFPKKNTRDLHFCKLSHSQRVAATENLSDKPFGVCVVASNKVTILDSTKLDIFKRKGHLYNYLVRLLLERLTTACAIKARIEGIKDPKLLVTFSRRAGTNYQSMRDYLLLMKNGKEVMRPVRSIDWSVFNPDDIRVENHSIRAGLQISDVLTSATMCALEPNEFGHIEPRYALALRQRYLKSQGKILNCGLTLVPPLGKCPLSREQLEFINEINKKSDRPPDP